MGSHLNWFRRRPMSSNSRVWLRLHYAVEGRAGRWCRVGVLEEAGRGRGWHGEGVPRAGHAVGALQAVAHGGCTSEAAGVATASVPDGREAGGTGAARNRV